MCGGSDISHIEARAEGDQASVLGKIMKKPAKFCLHEKDSVSDLESSSLAGFLRISGPICARSYNLGILEELSQRGHHESRMAGLRPGTSAG